MPAICQLDDAVSEARLLHGRNSGSMAPAEGHRFFSIFRRTAGRPIQRSYNMSMLDEVVTASWSSPDVYLSQSSFNRKNRKAVNVSQVRAAWVDLDLYNIGRDVNAQTVADILAHGESLGLPAPSSVISSGRGAYLKWYFERPVPASQLPIWQSLQATLTCAYSSLAADPKSRDVSRVLRLIGSVNSKSGQAVLRLDGSGQLHDFAGLCAQVEAFRAAELPAMDESAQGIEATAGLARVASASSSRANPFRHVLAGAERGDVEALQLYSELRRPILLEARSGRSLNWARFLDLRDLATSRGGIAVGERDLHMLWMLNSLAHAGVVAPSNWAHEVRALQQAFPCSDGFDPLCDGSMESLRKRLQMRADGVRLTWKGAKVDPLYRPGNEFLINTFSIKAEEMEPLRTIITPAVKKARRMARLDEKNAGRSQRRKDREQLRASVKKAFEAAQVEERLKPGALAGFNLTRLASSLNAERSAVSRVWIALVEEAGLVTVVAARRKRTFDKAEQPSGEDTPQAEQERLRRAQEALHQHRLSQFARQQAEAAEHHQQELALRMKIHSLIESWARRKLVGLVADASVPAELRSQDTQEDQDMTEANASLSPLERKMAMLHAAQGRGQMPSPTQRFATAHPPQIDLTPKMSAADRLRSKAARHQPVAPAAPAAPAERVAAGAADSVSREGPWAPVNQPSQSASPSSSAADRLREARKLTPPYRRDRIMEEAGPPLVRNGPAAPGSYPGPDQWADDDIAPGSSYTREEWASARQDLDGGQHAVIEIQTSTSSMLMQLPTSAKPQKRVIYKNGQARVTEAPETADSSSAYSILLGQIFSDCLLVTEDAWPRFAQAAEAKITHNGMALRVIRPRLDYLEPDLAWRVGAQWAEASAKMREEHFDANDEGPVERPSP